MKKNSFVSIRNEEGYALISVLLIGFLILSLFLGLFLVRYFNSILSERRIQKKKLDLAVCQGPSKPASQGHENLPPVLIDFASLAISILRVKFD